MANLLPLPPKQQHLVAQFYCACAPFAPNHHSMLQVDYTSRKCHMCNADVVGHEQHVVSSCTDVQHLRDMYPQLDFSQPTLSLFLTAHADHMSLYQFLAAVVRFAHFVLLHPP